MLVALITHAPDQIQKLRPVVDAARVTGEQKQQIKLFRGQADRLV